jgi:hypothetical protein
VKDAGPGRVDGLLWGAIQEGEWGQGGPRRVGVGRRGGLPAPAAPLAPVAPRRLEPHVRRRQRRRRPPRDVLPAPPDAADVCAPPLLQPHEHRRRLRADPAAAAPARAGARRLPPPARHRGQRPLVLGRRAPRTTTSSASRARRRTGGTHWRRCSTCRSR